MIEKGYKIYIVLRFDLTFCKNQIRVYSISDNALIDITERIAKMLNLEYREKFAYFGICRFNKLEDIGDEISLKLFQQTKQITVEFI